MSLFNQDEWDRSERCVDRIKNLSNDAQTRDERPVLVECLIQELFERVVFLEQSLIEMSDSNEDYSLINVKLRREGLERSPDVENDESS